MKDLTALMEDLGYENVRTYIQSGNVVFSNACRPDDRIQQAIKEKHGITSQVQIINLNELQSAAENNPFRQIDSKHCHFYFCKTAPESADTAKLEQLKSVSEKFGLTGKVFYLYAPDGIGRSRLAAGVETCLGVSATARNLNTVNRLLELARDATD